MQVEVLHNLSYQLRQITHHEPFDHEKLAEKGEWMDAHELIALVEKEKHEAIKRLQVTCRRQLPAAAFPSLSVRKPLHFVGVVDV